MREIDERFRYDLRYKSSRWHEVKTWAVECRICGRTVVTEAVEMPEDLPPNWDAYPDGLWCAECNGRAG